MGGGGMALKPIFPSCAPEEWEGPTPIGGHIDGYGGIWSAPSPALPAPRRSPFPQPPPLTCRGCRVGSGLRLGMTAYIDDVDEHGGCFTYWPTGHTAVARYFAKHPEAIDGSFQQLDGVRLDNEEGCESPRPLAWRARVRWLICLVLLRAQGRCCTATAERSPSNSSAKQAT
eukprot:COSAG04_NODE_3771_length_2545_cov_1.549060_5_plen_172_part_00